MVVARGQITISIQIDGQYTVFQYAKNTSATAAPSAGWSATAPACGVGEYLWLRSGVVVPPATTPAAWGAPSRVTGTPGEGRSGCIQRVSEWANGIEYRNDESLAVNGLRYVDVVVRNIGGVQYRFVCRQTHIASSANAPTASTTTSAYWQQVNDMIPIYTPLLLAKNASIDFLQGNSIRITDDSGNIYASLAAGDYPLLVGGATQAAAPFSVSKIGKMVAKDAEIVGKITATSGKIGVFEIGKTFYGLDGMFAKTANGGSASYPNYDYLSLYGSGIQITSEDYKCKFSAGSNVLSATAGMLANVFIENKYPGSVPIAGVIIDISGGGSGERNALRILHGTIAGFRLPIRRVAGTVDLTVMDSYLECSSYTRLRLPKVAEPGQVYYVCKQADNIGTTDIDGNGRLVCRPSVLEASIYTVPANYFGDFVIHLSPNGKWYVSLP